MIYIGFALRNPFSQRFDVIKEFNFSVTKNKSLEIGFYKGNALIGFHFNITGFKQDHKGFDLDLELLGYNFTVMFYDNRHAEHY